MDDSTSSSSTIDLNKNETRFIRLVHKFFRWLGRFIARHAILVIVICTAITVIGGIKMRRTPKRSDLTGYAPQGARSLYEHHVYEEFFGKHGQGIQILIMLMAKDNGTMLRNSHLNETVDLIDTISQEFSIYNEKKGKNETFMEFCYGFCQYNEPVRQFYNGFQVQQISRTNRVDLRYPKTTMFGRKFSLQPNFFGIELFSDAEMAKFDETNTQPLSNIKSAKMIVLQFRAERDESWQQEHVKQYEIAVSDYFENTFKSDHIRALVVTPYYVQKEIQRGGLKLQPFISVGFALMLVFTIATTLISTAFAGQCSWYKIINAFFAVVVPLMSVAASFGILFFIGVRFGPILLVTPFLILAIGVDDSFLMMHAWQRVVQKLRKHPRDDDSIEYRLGEVLAEAGPSICISALTNIMAFSVGAFTSPPEVELFCIANAFTIFVDTVFSVTIYAAVMALCGERDMKNESDAPTVNCLTKVISKTKDHAYAFLDKYIKWLTHIGTSLCILVVFGVYIAVSIYGTLNFGIDLSAEKFFLSDSRIVEAEKLRLQYVVPYYSPVIVVINNPGDLSNVDRIEALNEMVERFEKLNDSIGPDSTMYFMRDYQSYKDPFDEDPDTLKPFNASDLDAFIGWPEYSFWRGFLQTANNSFEEFQLNKFFFLTAFNGTHLRDWHERSRLLDTVRHEAANPSIASFNATIHTDDAMFLDLINVIPSVTWQSALATLVCMLIACVLFMADPFTVTVSTSAICSICIGIFGFLHYWGISQDPIMMAAVLMSIGFSVDIPAHIAFHYYRTGGTNIEGNEYPVEQRLRTTLAAVGFPVVQAGISTNLCVLSLLMVKLYMGEVFVKSMVLCVSLGLLHGLFVMPAVFNLSFVVKRWFRKLRKHKICSQAGDNLAKL
uniref:SSD domain-containing protein n=1 Tax=Panagrellus redivivus TaxID=6233 RepID=A0A7E4ZWC4_PANRE